MSAIRQHRIKKTVESQSSPHQRSQMTEMRNYIMPVDRQCVLNLGPDPVPDSGIWARAAAEDRIVVSKDEDFFHPANRTGDTGRCSGSPFFGVTQRRKDAKGRRLSVHFFAPLREASLNSGTPSDTGA